MNRKQRRTLAKKQRLRGKKMKQVENRMGTDFDAVKALASTLEAVQTTLLTVKQAIEEIPSGELNSAKLLEDVEECAEQLQHVRKSGSSMGTAVQGALEEAVAKSDVAVAELRTLLGVGEDAE
jgi:hypothetical protein